MLYHLESEVLSLTKVGGFWTPALHSASSLCSSGAHVSAEVPVVLLFLPQSPASSHLLVSDLSSSTCDFVTSRVLLGLPSKPFVSRVLVCNPRMFALKKKVLIFLLRFPGFLFVVSAFDTREWRSRSCL